MKDRKNILIIALLITMTFLTVSYATTVAKLDMKNIATTIINPKWNVAISDIENVEIVGNAESVSYYIEGTTAKFYTKLTDKKDSLTYNVTVKNKGNVDIILRSIVQSPENDNYLIFSASGLNNKVPIKANSSLTFEVTIRFNEQLDIPQSEFDVTKEFLLALNYEQYK